MADNEATHEVDATEKTIREGYVEESQEEVKEESQEEEFLSPREKLMREIVDVREKEEMGEELEATEEVEQEVEEAVRAPDAPIWNEEGKWFTKIKVDGEEVSVPFDDLKSSHQKDKASQKRFEDAAAYGRQIQAREEQLNAYVGQQLKQQQAATTTAATHTGSGTRRAA